MLRSTLKKISFATLSIILPGVVFAATSSSSNYSIDRDMLATAGGVSASVAYAADDITADMEVVDSSGMSYLVKYGFLPSSGGFIAMTSPSNVALSTTINIAGGQSNGDASWTVVTDNSAGYTLMIKSSASPAMTSGSNSFADYAGGVGPLFDWSVNSADSRFGFSPEGVDVATAYKDNGSACGVGVLTTSDKCWDGLTTSYKTIAQGSSPNNPNGVATTVRFRAEAGASRAQSAGSYKATIYVTALAL